LEAGTIQPSRRWIGFDRVYYGQLLREVVRQKPELAQFDGMLHNNHVAEFQHLDEERLALAKYRTLMAHFEGLPLSIGCRGNRSREGRDGTKTGPSPVRRLLKDAGSVVQAIKPVL